MSQMLRREVKGKREKKQGMDFKNKKKTKQEFNCFLVEQFN